MRYATLAVIAMAGLTSACGLDHRSLHDDKNTLILMGYAGGDACYYRIDDGILADQICQAGDMLRYSSSIDTDISKAKLSVAEDVPIYVSSLFRAFGDSRIDLDSQVVAPPERTAPVVYETYRSIKD